MRLLAETGMRAGELLALNTADVDLGRGLAVVRRGKGGKGRVVASPPDGCGGGPLPAGAPGPPAGVHSGAVAAGNGEPGPAVSGLACRGVAVKGLRRTIANRFGG